MALEFKTTEFGTYTFVEFTVDGVLNSQELRGLTAPEVNASTGVVLSGRGPIWLYGYLVHEYHPAAWVACYDPRLGGGVVVKRHAPHAPKLGEVLPIPEAY